MDLSKHRHGCQIPPTGRAKQVPRTRSLGTWHRNPNLVSSTSSETIHVSERAGEASASRQRVRSLGTKEAYVTNVVREEDGETTSQIANRKLFHLTDFSKKIHQETFGQEIPRKDLLIDVHSHSRLFSCRHRNTKRKKGTTPKALQWPEGDQGDARELSSKIRRRFLWGWYRKDPQRIAERRQRPGRAVCRLPKVTPARLEKAAHRHTRLKSEENDSRKVR